MVSGSSDTMKSSILGSGQNKLIEPNIIQTIINNLSYYTQPQSDVDVLLLTLTFLFITALFRKDTLLFDSCYSGVKFHKNDTYAEYNKRLYCLFKLDISFFAILLTGLLVIPLFSDMIRSVNTITTEQYFNKLNEPLLITSCIYLIINVVVIFIKWFWGYLNQSNLTISPLSSFVVRSFINGVFMMWLIILIILKRAFV